MINNPWPVAFAALLGCSGAQAEDAGAYQGVVEHEERLLAFEVGGRLVRLDASEGDAVEADTVIAALDDSLERALRDARAAEVAVAEAELELVREGPRAEEIRAARAELRAARASEQLLGRTVQRQRALVARGAATPAQVDELETQLARATAQQQSVAQRLRALEEGARTEELAVGEARLAAARSALVALDERLQRYELRAGIEGVVLDVHVEPGEIVAPGAPVVTVADVERPYVDAFVPQGDLAGIEIGTAARVRVDAHDEAYAATVEHVARRTEFTPRYLFSERERPNLVVRVRVRIQDPAQTLSAGVPGFTTFERARR